jgi:3-oxoacyl-[acyl-carrier-protein] synthase II
VLTRRVVITGVGAVTALGEDWPSVRARMLAGQTAVRTMHEWERFGGINTRLAAPVPNFSLPDRYSRKKTRTMGRVSCMAVYASEKALAEAGLTGDPVLGSGRCGVAYGSSFGSPPPIVAFAELLNRGASPKLNATSYIQLMSHTAAVNIALFFGFTGRIIPTSSACTSGSQAIGYAAESIRSGKADVMVAGGADELDVTQAAVFDTLFATSTRNDAPDTSPRPYDRDRDGLVIGEGAATLVLEERERALARGASIFAEIVGFGCNCDGNHATQPRAETMEIGLRLALEDAGLDPGAIGFVSGHGTATEWGDVEETRATHAVFGSRAPLHSLKSYFGHTLGACGAIEAWLAIAMMRDDLFVPTVNLAAVDERCADLDYVKHEPRRIETDHVMSNNFAFGGINTSLIFKRV